MKTRSCHSHIHTLHIKERKRDAMDRLREWMVVVVVVVLVGPGPEANRNRGRRGLVTE